MHCLFASGPRFPEIAVPRGGTVNRYRVNAVEVVQGPAPALPRPGWELVRVETEMAVPASAPIQLRGVTGAAQYTDPNARTAAAHGAKPIPAEGDAVLAVILGLRKTAAWYALPFEQRQAQMPAHVDVGEPYIPAIHRRLFHSREWTKEYDFVTYFEFRAVDEPQFRALCRGLRDPKRNPEWAFIDRDFEIWMTKLA